MSDATGPGAGHAPKPGLNDRLASARAAIAAGLPRFHKKPDPGAGINAGEEAGGGLDARSAPKLHPAVFISSIVINIMALALPLVILQVYDRVLPNNATDTLMFLILGLCAVMALDTVMKIARAYMVGWAAAKSAQAMAVDAVARILASPASRIERDAPGVHIDRLNAIDALRDFNGGQSRLLMLDLPFLPLFLGLVAYIGGALVIVPLVLFCGVGVLAVLSGRALRGVLQRRSENDDKRYDFIIEAISGIQTIKLMAMEPQIQRRYERLQRATAEATYDTIILGNAAQSFGNLFATGTIISVVTVGALMVVAGSISVGSLACCTLLVGRSVQPVMKGLGLWTQMQSLTVARAKAEELFKLPPAAGQAGPARERDLRGEVEFRDIVIERDGHTVMSVPSLNIAAGEIFGIRGPDNSGKSEVLGLLTGEVAARSGKVLIDGYDVASPDRRWINGRIAYVSQAGAIFRGTILENIAMFRHGDAIDAAREAARLIGLEADIHRLPEGYDMMLSAGIAEEIPGGLMQRVAIARALARKPAILIFDEANSSLDGRGEALLRTGLERLRGKTTIVLVSNRPSFLTIADRIYETGNAGLREVAHVPPRADMADAPADVHPMTARRAPLAS